MSSSILAKLSFGYGSDLDQCLDLIGDCSVQKSCSLCWTTFGTENNDELELHEEIEQHLHSVHLLKSIFYKINDEKGTVPIIYDFTMNCEILMLNLTASASTCMFVYKVTNRFCIQYLVLFSTCAV